MSFLIKKTDDAGFSMIEILVVLSIAAIMMVMAVTNINALSNPSVTSVNQVMGILKLARARAIATTSPYLVVPVGRIKIVGKRATTCNDSSPTLDPHVSYDLPEGVTFANSLWSVCYSSRGIASTGVDISITDQKGVTKIVEVMRGGAVRIKPN